MTERRTGRWLMEFRRKHLLLQPCCMMCERAGRLTVGTQVDHIVSLHMDGLDFDVDPDNAQTLCDACHEIKTAQDLGYTIRTQSDADGMPVDASHRWNQG